MKKFALAAAACLPLVLSVSAPVGAQGSANTSVLADRLGQCMVSKTTGADRIAVASWMLAAMASAPQLKDVAVVTPARKEQADRTMATVFTRLMTKDCATDAKALFAARDPQAFQQAGRPLGEVAMKELISNPKTMEALGAYVRYINPADFAAVAGGF
jgi:hypothetical protein